MEIVISIAAKIGEYLVAPIGRQPGYLIYYNSNMRTLKTEVEKLGHMKIRVQHSVEAAINNRQLIEDDVDSWLTRVNGINEEVERFFEDEVKVNKGCLRGWCPDLSSRYSLSRKAKKKTPVVIELQGEGSFETVSYPASEGYDDNIKSLKTEVEKLGHMKHSVDEAKRRGEVIEPDVERWLTRVNGINEEVERFLKDEVEAIQRYLRRYSLSREAEEKTRVVISREAEEKARVVIELQGQHSRYSLSSEVQNLRAIKGAVQLSVDEAKRRGEVIGPDVERWLTRVNGINEEVERFLEDEVEGEDTGREVKEKTRAVIELQGQGSFQRVSYPAPPLGIEYMATGSFTDFESRKSIIDEIMAALKDDSISAIGICGLGGIGKTTTVTEVGKRAKAEKLFDEIVMAVVSQTPDLKKIQGEIADMLGLKFDEESSTGRACKLCTRLMDNRVLVILDDVWARLDLQKVGIPFGGDSKGCKVLLTSRSQVVCKEMRTRRNFTIGVLSEPEVWSLFKEMAGNSINAPALHRIAKDVVKECGGLPIAIVTVGRALENEQQHAWNDALRQLRKSMPENISGMDANVYRSLKLSYDLLESQEAKSCLLLCCVFEEDANIPVEDLVRYGMGLGLFKSIDTLVEARDRVHTLVDKLKSCYLLLDGNHWNDEECVKMHDVVCDVIRSIATTKGTDKQYTSISLNISNNIYEPPDRLDCPKLELLLLDGQYDSLKAPDNLFEGMKELKVLELGNMGFVPSPPPSLSILTKLQTLCLQDCKLENISVIGELETLIILSFRNSSIEELPSEIGKLTHLRLLDLTRCRSLTIISPGVISSLTRLEELYMLGSKVQWKVEEGGKKKNNVNLAELQSLGCLVALETHLPTATFPGSNFLFENLVRFKIFISIYGRNNSWFPRNQLWNELRLNFEASTIPVESAINVLPKKTDALDLEGMKNPKDLIRESSVRLKSLKLKSCDVNNLKMMCHGQLLAGSFGKLRDVYLSYLPKLMHLWKGPTQLVSLGNLTRMKVEGCHRLENVFSQFVARGLVQLEYLEIRNCRMIEEIVATERGEHEEEATKNFCEKMDEIEFPRLRELRLVVLPKLRSFWPNSVGTQQLFNEKVIFPSMEELTLQGNDNVERIGHDQLPAGSLCKLRKMYVRECNKLLNVGPSNLLQRLENLEELTVEDCPLLVEVFEIEGLNVEERDIVLLSKLKQLHLEYLPKLKHIWNSVFSKEPKGIHLFQSLSFLHVWGCNSLRNLFSPSMAKSAKQLQVLLISECETMTEIVAEDKGEEDEKVMDMIEFPQLRCLTLEGLPILVSFFPKANTAASKFLFNEKVSFPSLKELKLFDMNNLKGIWYNRLPTCSFSELRVMTVSNCDNLEEVVVIEYDSLEQVRTDEIGIPRLKNLGLSSLPNLTSFCQGLFSFDLPLLEDVSLHNCPKMKTFSFGFLSTPKLEGVKVGLLEKLIWRRHTQNLEGVKVGQSWPKESFWMGDLNNAIQQLFERKDEFLWFSGDFHLLRQIDGEVDSDSVETEGCSNGSLQEEEFSGGDVDSDFTETGGCSEEILQEKELFAACSAPEEN